MDESSRKSLNVFGILIKGGRFILNIKLFYLVEYVSFLQRKPHSYEGKGDRVYLCVHICMHMA